ncbi:hypothetical protein Hte_007571 [Hypoxylon texense]
MAPSGAFSHPESRRPTVDGTPSKAQKTQSAQGGDSNEDAFHKWRRLIPRASPGRPQSFGHKLPQFFQGGYKLVQGDLNMLQRTITELATEQGALAIREMIEERVLYCRTDRDRFNLWRTCIHPFFQMLTEPRVARSAILEIHTGTIYNVVLGSNASRLEMLFNFLIDLAARWEMEPRLVNDDEPKCEFLEICTQILSKAIHSNTKNLANEIIPQIVSRMQESIESLAGNDRNFWTLQATKHLEYIQRRLRATKQVGSVPMPSALEHATFSLRRDLPGKLSPDGPRHDNDSEDITQIRILPTMSEIVSDRTDYRPVHDLSQLHLSGIQGLIDRHFRLLREDMIGPLKEYVSEELQVLAAADHDHRVAPRQKSGIRTYSYTVVEISNATCTRRGGLEFHLKIEQPLAASKLSNEARENWWDLSRRLEIGALVCFLQKGTAVFCVVSESTNRPNPTRKTSKSNEQVTEKRNLYSSNKFAYVSLNLAEPTDADLGLMLRTLLLNHSSQQSLVEFPGVLLPSFKHTLSALQSIFKSLDLPFADLLAPSFDRLPEDTIPPPLYAAKPQFAYNLKCLTSDGIDLLFSPRDEPNPQELCHRSSLDLGQATALLNALRRSLALIQGPPGTGKSYTGEAIIKVLLANKKKARTGPILCVCYTNHALDQLLEHLWHGGVKQIIRIGSRSKSPILADLNLRNVGKDADRTRSEKKSSWQTAMTLTQTEVGMKNYMTGLRSATIAQRVKDNVKAQAPQLHDAIFGVEEDGWTKVTRRDEHALLLHWISAGSLSESSPRDIDVLREEDSGALSHNERALLCANWGSEVVSDLEEELVSLHDDYQKAKRRYGAAVREVDIRVLQEADIIGVTTTGLAKNLDLLRHLDSKVLLCEEAGEVLESHILTALLPSIEHAILIGDHLQLRPQIVNYELCAANPHGEKYSLDVSLFERLVQPVRPTDPRLPFDTLEVQRRMHPSISGLIRGTLYDSLKDAESVKGYPGVVGMKKRLFWFNHDEPESGSDPSHPTSTSRTNDFEVEMVCALVSHLVRQGVYGRDDVAVLTPYLGQLLKLKRKLQNSFEVVVDDRDLEELQNEGLDTTPQVYKQALGRCLRLATVDNFQGEEAQVVVISLVRSNQDRQCGFLKTKNRINVLLSRAKHGMYIIGNSATYGAVEMWSDVIAMLKRDGNFGTKLPLQCPRHKAKAIEVSGPDDFVRLSPEAGCNAQCSLLLDCGHACLTPCNWIPCSKRCDKLLRCGHQCPSLCGELCPDEELCQICASPEVKATVVDMRGTRQYCNIDLDMEPCVFMRCGHFMTVSSMDDQLGMGDYYEIATDGAIIAMKTLSKSLSGDCFKACPHCKGSLRDISRYGRVVRQTVLDESTRQFVRWYHAEWAGLEQRVVAEQKRLVYAEKPAQLLELVAKPGGLNIEGAFLEQLFAINDWIGGDRYLPIIRLYATISDYLYRVQLEEESYQHANGHAQHTAEAYKNIGRSLAGFRTRGQLLARIVRFRCYLAALEDFLHLRYRAKKCFTMVTFNLDTAVDECERIITSARIAKYALQEIEGHVFYAKIVAMARLANDAVQAAGDEQANVVADDDIFDDRVLPDLVVNAKAHLFQAELLIHKYVSEVNAWAEFEVAVNMLFDRVTYYEHYKHPRAKWDGWSATARGFADPGRLWYACTEGHPFTVAADEESMEAIKCPECLASAEGEF